MYPNHPMTEALEHVLIVSGSYLGLRRSNEFGSTYVPMTFKIQRTSE